MVCARLVHKKNTNKDCDSRDNNNNNNNNNNGRGHSKDLESTIRTLTGSRSKQVLLKMQKATLSSSLTIARHFKVMT